MDRLRLGIIGCGAMAQSNLKAYADLFDLQACCDTNEETCEKVRSEFGFERSYADGLDLIRDPQIEAICLSTPPQVRREIVEEAARHSKHVISEKPFALSFEDGRAMVEACDAAGVQLAVAQNYRYYPHIQEARKILASGQVGTPFVGIVLDPLIMAFPMKDSTTSGYRWKLKQMLLIEMCCHHFDNLRFLLGCDAVEVYSKIGKAPFREAIGEIGETWTVTTITFENGCVISLYDSWDCKGMEKGGGPFARAHFECDKGSLFLNPDEETTVSAYVEDRQEWMKPLGRFDANWGQVSLRRTMETFVEAITTGKAAPTSGRDNLGTIGISFAAYKSAEENRPVRIEEIHRS